VFQRQARDGAQLRHRRRAAHAARGAGKWPLLRTDDLQARCGFPADGKANPRTSPRASPRGARNLGVKMFEACASPASAAERRVVRRETDRATIAARRSSTAPASGRARSARRAASACRCILAEHFYIVTEPIAGVHHDLPVMRDPDGFIYFKEEVGGLLMGGFEPDGQALGHGRHPERFEFQLLPRTGTSSSR
jgi:4-methylaminobutanoate oxidase (formaldehyde-forming)